ncbi:MAG: SPFH/Band 7/PHB domain protein, partial [Blastocatellia bacterium]|nr:SPFH/Band 7/PHB domain protein [Blastocatellia bacterium]
MELFITLLIIVPLIMVILAKTIRIIPQATVMAIERLGKFDRLAKSGLNMVTPFLDRPRGVYWTGLRQGTNLIDLRERYTELTPQPVITRDNVTILVDSIIYWQITDPVKAVYEVNDLIGGIIQLTITAMRNVIGE